MSEKAFTPAELNQGFVVAIQIVAKAGEEDIVASALAALIKPTMAEAGVKLFLPYRSPTDPTAFSYSSCTGTKLDGPSTREPPTSSHSSTTCCRASRSVSVSPTCHTRQTPRATERRELPILSTKLVSPLCP